MAPTWGLSLVYEKLLLLSVVPLGPSYQSRYFGFGISPRPLLHTPLPPPYTENILLTQTPAIHTTEQFQQFGTGWGRGSSIKDRNKSKEASIRGERGLVVGQRGETTCGLRMEGCSTCLWPLHLFCWPRVGWAPYLGEKEGGEEGA